MKALLALALLLAAAGCAMQPSSTTQPVQKPAAPQITEDMLRGRAKEQLAAGQRQYEAGEYEAASRSLAAALDHGLLSKPDQARARKLLAFIHCVGGREVLCRDEFRKAFEIYPDFALTAAEDGHPIWGPVYRNVRTQLITEREAASERKSVFTPRGKGEATLQEGMIKYEAGDYPAAARMLQSAIAEGLEAKELKVRAMKHIAFSLCLQEKWRDCREAFIRIYDVDPEFDLTPAEAGHPSWTRTFAGAKARAKKALAEKAEHDKARTAKDKPSAAPPPAASAPKKN
ncbi:MAG TPA: TssQ family T6SS-associated lipoprotein [Usitatibacter sp.]|nr:TssQ family T6SS-associated lipoprotein [Usitatibacter sp.]